MLMRRAFLFPALACILGALGCSHTPAAEPQPSEKRAEKAVIPDDKARVTAQDIVYEIRRMGRKQAASAVSSPQELQEVIELLYKRRVISNQANVRGYVDEPRLRKGLERARHIELMRQVPQLYLEDQEIPSFADAARQYYEDNLKDEFFPPERIRVSQIMLQARSKAAREEARERMQRILNALEEGKDFGTLANKHSQDAARFTRGDLGFIERGERADSFERAAFALEDPGDYSGIVETPYGLHIVKLLEKPKHEPIPFEKVRARLIQKLKREHMQRMVDNWVERLAPQERYTLESQRLQSLLKDVRGALGVDGSNNAEGATTR